jgi:hypothetical protein
MYSGRQLEGRVWAAIASAGAAARASRSTTTQPRAAAKPRFQPYATGPGQDQPLTASMQARGYLRWWWQVLGSNQRRLSRRFYSETAVMDTKMR